MFDELIEKLQTEYSRTMKRVEKLSECQSGYEGCWSKDAAKFTEAEHWPPWSVCGHCHQQIIKSLIAERDAARAERKAATKALASVCDDLGVIVTLLPEQVIKAEQEFASREEYMNGYADGCMDMRVAMMQQLNEFSMEKQ